MRRQGWIPAFAGMTCGQPMRRQGWIPAFAGMTCRQPMRRERPSITRLPGIERT